MIRLDGDVVGRDPVRSDEIGRDPTGKSVPGVDALTAAAESDARHTSAHSLGP